MDITAAFVVASSSAIVRRQQRCRRRRVRDTLITLPRAPDEGTCSSVEIRRKNNIMYSRACHGQCANVAAVISGRLETYVGRRRRVFSFVFEKT